MIKKFVILMLQKMRQVIGRLNRDFLFIPNAKGV